MFDMFTPEKRSTTSKTFDTSNGKSEVTPIKNISKFDDKSGDIKVRKSQVSSLLS